MARRTLHIDYIFHWLGMQFNETYRQEKQSAQPASEEINSVEPVSDFQLPKENQ